MRVVITNKPDNDESGGDGAGDGESSAHQATADDKLHHMTYNRSTIEEMSHEDSIMDNDQLHVGQ